MKDKRTISTSTFEDNMIYHQPSLQISDEVKDRIIRNYIEPSYQYDISKLIEGKKSWKLVGQTFETMSKALVAIGGIVSFAAGSYSNYNLSFIAGAVSTISLATLSFSSFGYKEQKKQGLELNNLLKKLKLDDVPINERSIEDIASSGGSMARQSSQRQFPPQSEQIFRQQIEISHLREECMRLNEILMKKEKEDQDPRNAEISLKIHNDNDDKKEV